MPFSNSDLEFHWFGNVEMFPIHILLHHNECSRWWPLHKRHCQGERGHAVHWWSNAQLWWERAVWWQCFLDLCLSNSNLIKHLVESKWKQCHNQDHVYSFHAVTNSQINFNALVQKEGEGWAHLLNKLFWEAPWQCQQSEGYAVGIFPNPIGHVGTSLPNKLLVLSGVKSLGAQVNCYKLWPFVGILWA